MAESDDGEGSGRLGRAYGWVDARLDLDSDRDVLGKAFPAEDSFLLGEVALFCFLVLVLTGMFLGFFFEPSTSDVTYEGSVERFQGQDVPEAFASVLNITYDVPFGMLLRRMHHWAAHLFIASMALHMLRVFFTGAYRNPREPNWLVGTGLAGLSMGAAYTGYALPFDEFASTATGIGYNLASSIPLAGGALSKLVFGGSFPSSATIPRFYFLHVLVIPLAIAGLIGVHMLILMRQKHTEAERDEDVPGPAPPAEGAAASGGTAAVTDGAGDGPAATDGGVAGTVRAKVAGAVDRNDDSVIVGLPAFPNQAAVSAVVFFLTLATLALLAGFLPVHNVAEYGPNDPAGTPALIMPDWFLMWVYGFLKLLPSWLAFHVPILGEVNAEFVGGILMPGLVFGAVAAWPFVDYYRDPEHFALNPLDRPKQTAVGVFGVTFIMVASIAGMNNIAADALGTETGAVNAVLWWALLGWPTLCAAVTYGLLGGNDADEPEAANGGADAGSDERPETEGER
ncbi:menaquinol-cytochrome-c reductase [Halosimplex carlsbadense 2-9-1]|uniref:Menaquinol-cytochrome-c reductase n=1 Tax=Halosimplex carlsbadense 2-9-1 TaxID=797114 RepID=M0CGC1_9EURY|nr:cytochrome bc complex cytochrome b subunit [Halosimplex carlsbadense]ELZ22301.1 menaquinol-cytochrome-c reductase [Halosimplex carlsbadense 2-9-1]